MYAAAERLGIDRAGADKVIARAGGSREALRHLLDRERRGQRAVLRRAEREELEAEATRRRQVYESQRPVHQAERAQQRAALTLGQRLDRTLAAVLLLSTASAASPETSVSTGKPGEQDPPRAETLDVGPSLAIIRHHIAAIENMLDAAQGIADPHNYRLMSNAQKDRIIVANFAGVNSKQLACDVPELGSARTIERTRRAAGMRPSNGLERHDYDSAVESMPGTTG